MAIKIQARPTSRATTRLTVTHGWRIWCSNPVGLKQNQVSLCIKTRLFNDIGISDYSSKLTVVPCCWNRGWSDRWSFAGSERGRALRNTLCAKSKACQLNPKQSPRWWSTDREGRRTHRTRREPPDPAWWTPAEPRGLWPDSPWGEFHL